MWHYVLDSADESVLYGGEDSAVAHFIRDSLRGDSVLSLTVREPYFSSAAHAEQGLFDGSAGDLDSALPMILAAVVDDDSWPSCRFEGTAGQYVIIGLDGEVYLGLTVRQDAAERAARRRGLIVHISDSPPPYLSLPGDAVDPVLDDTVWSNIAKRVEGEPVLALERWANGRYGEQGHMLRSREDVAHLTETIHPRAGLALFSARAIVPTDEVRAKLSGASTKRAQPESRLVYQRDRHRPLAVVSFFSLRELDALLTGLPESSEPFVLEPPTFEAWFPPEVETYVLPDTDGVVRSRLGYHVREPD